MFLTWSPPVNQFPIGEASATTTDKSNSYQAECEAGVSSDGDSLRRKDLSWRGDKAGTWSSSSCPNRSSLVPRPAFTCILEPKSETRSELSESLEKVALRGICVCVRRLTLVGVFITGGEASSNEWKICSSESEVTRGFRLESSSSTLAVESEPRCARSRTCILRRNWAVCVDMKEKCEEIKREGSASQLRYRRPPQ